MINTRSKEEGRVLIGCHWARSVETEVGFRDFRVCSDTKIKAIT
jgi:hypothetical protein